MRALVTAQLVTLLAPLLLWGDGGSVVLRKSAGVYAVSVFAAPLAAGPSDLTVLVQDAVSLEPVLDAAVSLEVCGTVLSATRHQARNKLLYQATANLPEGDCRILVRVTGRAGKETFAGGIFAGAASGVSGGWAWFVLPAPLGMLLLGLHRYLSARPTRR